MTFHYIIIGQGLSGSFLSWQLIRRGCKVLVIDDPQPATSSKIASGVINPVTGRRLVRTWQIETLMPFAVQAYTELGNELGVPLIRQCDIVDFHTTPQMKLAFAERQPEEEKYLRLPANENAWRDHFNYPFGYGEIAPCWLIDINTMLQSWRKKLAATGSLLEERFDITRCTITPDKVQYGDITADKVFFCDGAAGFDNPYFRLLPYARNKGEALIVEIPGLPRNHIFKHGITVVPWQLDLFWVGSTYEWNFTDTLPTEAFRKKAEQQLSHWIRHTYRIVDHLASERPANLERRPFAGIHPGTPSVGILNGMGTKGCSLAPYFSAQLAAHVIDGAPIDPAADITRFSRILTR